MKRSLVGTLGCLLVTGLAVVGCSSKDDTAQSIVPGVDTGSLVQNWTIEGSTDASKCAQYNADRMRVVVYDEDGTVHATEFGKCTDFRIEMKLLTRRYTGAATFVDTNGNAVSKTVGIAPFQIVNNQTLTQNLDFSADRMTP